MDTANEGMGRSSFLLIAALLADPKSYTGSSEPLKPPHEMQACPSQPSGAVMACMAAGAGDGLGWFDEINGDFVEAEPCLVGGSRIVNLKQRCMQMVVLKEVASVPYVVDRLRHIIILHSADCHRDPSCEWWWWWWWW